MEKEAPEQVPGLSAEQVIAWLRSPAGERWSRDRIGFSGQLRSHLGAVCLAEVIPDSAGKHAAARWPRPLMYNDLGEPG